MAIHRIPERIRDAVLQRAAETLPGELPGGRCVRHQLIKQTREPVREPMGFPATGAVTQFWVIMHLP